VVVHQGAARLSGAEATRGLHQDGAVTGDEEGGKQRSCGHGRLRSLPAGTAGPTTTSDTDDLIGTVKSAVRACPPSVDTVKWVTHDSDVTYESPSTNDVRASLLAAARSELVEHGHAAISLRAVARRAGVSHAAPKYYFCDRAALLTAVATQGFNELAAALAQVQPSLAAAGHTYIDFGLNNAALFDLMFRPSELHPDDPDLKQAQQLAIGKLNSAVAKAERAGDQSRHGSPELTLLSWAVAHGLTVLARDGALQAASGHFPDAGATLARDLADAFTERVTNHKERAQLTDPSEQSAQRPIAGR